MTKIFSRSIALGIGIGIVALLAFWLGKKIGKDDTKMAFTENISIIKNIAELSVLEVQGTTKLTSSNLDSSTNWVAGFANFFAENTASVIIPYTAKYGVNLDQKEPIVFLNGKELTLTLPQPVLLSLELKMDKMETYNKKGLLVFSDENYYVKHQKQLYSNTRTNMASNKNLIDKSRQRLNVVFNKFYLPLGFTVQVKFFEK